MNLPPSSAASSAYADWKPGRIALTSLAAITLINLLNFADRFVLGGVQELIKRDPTLTGGPRDAAGLLTDASLGTLTTAFVIVFMLASPITGVLGDRLPRKWLVFGGVLIWSVATLLSGLAPTYGTLIAARALIGAGEAGYATVAPSLLADLFAPSWRGKALGIFNVVMPLGAALGFGLGGFIGASHGWRTAFFLAGAPGLLIAVAFLFLPEPARGGFDEGEQKGKVLPPLEAFRTLAANRPFVVNCIGQTLMNFTVGGLSNWMPSFLVRTSGLTQEQAGLWFGVITAVAGISGAIVGTVLGERAEARHRGGYFRVSGWSLAASAPFIVLFSMSPGREITLLATFCALFLVLLNTGPLYAALVNSVPATQRATAVAANILVIHLLGDALSPTLIGFISDTTGNLGLAVGMNAVPVVIGGVVLVLGARRLFGPVPELPAGGGAPA